MSNLLFSRDEVLSSAKKVKAAIIKSRSIEAHEEWSYIHRQPYLFKILKIKPKQVPEPSVEWIEKHVKNNELNGIQLNAAERFEKYCNRSDAAQTLAISLEDAASMWLI